MPLGSPSRPVGLQRGSGGARRAARRSLSGEGPGAFFSCRCLILPLVARFPSSRFPPGEFLLPEPRAREGSLTSAVVRGGRIRRGAVRTAHLFPGSPWSSSRRAARSRRRTVSALAAWRRGGIGCQPVRSAAGPALPVGAQGGSGGRSGEGWDPSALPPLRFARKFIREKWERESHAPRVIRFGCKAVEEQLVLGSRDLDPEELLRWELPLKPE
ncbi:PREDICTED: uncharacterized protein LOC101813330 [Ficedula albicollis]|uniref:uncharacterized protein LOC101813330 n=1 Tax=Ficedula albicollis TaxID=59894 RepID=UPI00035946E4|nr:PREDICTED: uncharacterized protein LOC101813330 [Ficedula albicollis]